MRFRKLGHSGLLVSEISLGSWLTYSGGAEAEQTRACTDAAFDKGLSGEQIAKQVAVEMKT
jgi:aryl-alcohol dehydrogenase-like predicted oxidoreductase